MSALFLAAVRDDGIVLSVDDGERDTLGHYKGCLGHSCEATRCAWTRAMVGLPVHDRQWSWRWTRGDR